MADDEGLVLNLALPAEAAPHPSRTQQRKQSWRQQRAIKVRPPASRMLLEPRCRACEALGSGPAPRGPP